MTTPTESDITRWLPLVKRISSRLYQERCVVRRIGDFEDVYQVGCRGLIEAFRTFKPGEYENESRRSAHLRSYLSEAVRRSILTQARLAGVIYVPEYMAHRIAQDTARPSSRNFATRSPAEGSCRYLDDAKRAYRCKTIGGANVIDKVCQPENPDDWSEEVKLALDRIPVESSEILARRFGIGREQENVRRLMKAYGVCRTTMRKRLRIALEEFKTAMASMGIDSID